MNISNKFRGLVYKALQASFICKTKESFFKKFVLWSMLVVGLLLLSAGAALLAKARDNPHLREVEIMQGYIDQWSDEGY